MIAAAFFWIACGFAALCALPLVYEREKDAFQRSEPFYACPVVQTSPGVAVIRNDEIGKGNFATSRSNNRTHKGIDLSSPLDGPVFASKSGRVFFAGFDKGYGAYIELRHPDGLLTRYAHLSAMTVRPGEWVSIGQVIGTSGKTGNADDPKILPHLHFEIRYKGQALNPVEKLLDPGLSLKQA